jgi:hypothetical protein
MKSVWLLTPLVAALLVAAAPPAAVGASPNAKKDLPPTLLWRAFPLQERPAAATGPSPSVRAAETRNATPTRSSGGRSFPLSILFGLLVAAIAAITLLLVQQLVPVVGVRRPLGGRPHRSSPVGAMAWVHWPRRRSRTSVAAKPSESARDDLLEALRPQPAPARKVRRKIEKVVPAGRMKMLPAPPEPEPASDPLPAQPEGRAVESCRIELWRGYVKSQLYAAPLDHGGTPPVGLFFSPFFRLRDEETPTKKAGVALQLLTERLERHGWEVVSNGPRWYQLRLERPRSS